MAQDNDKYGHDRRRAALLETARQVFLARGYAATSMDDIAVAHGGSKTTLYKYFPSKNDLFNAIVEAQSIAMRQQLNVFSGMADDIRTVLACFCRRILSIMLSEDMIAFERLIVSEAVHFPETAHAAYALGFKEALDYWEKIIQEAIDAGQLRQGNAKMATAYLLSLSEGPLKKLRLWGISNAVTTKNIDVHADIIVAIFLAAFGNDELARQARQCIDRGGEAAEDDILVS